MVKGSGVQGLGSGAWGLQFRISGFGCSSSGVLGFGRWVEARALGSSYVILAEVLYGLYNAV